MLPPVNDLVGAVPSIIRSTLDDYELHLDDLVDAGKRAHTGKGRVLSRRRQKLAYLLGRVGRV